MHLNSIDATDDREWRSFGADSDKMTHFLGHYLIVMRVQYFMNDNFLNTMNGLNEVD